MTGPADPQDDAPGLVIEIEQELPAGRERVFRQWTDAEALARWFAPPGYKVAYSETDPRPGGVWRLDFRSESGAHRYTERGSYHQVEPWDCLVLTLTQVDGDHTNPETLITVELHDVGTREAPRTLMRFTQTGYRSPALREDNEQGWRGCFSALVQVLD